MTLGSLSHAQPLTAPLNLYGNAYRPGNLTNLSGGSSPVAAGAGGGGLYGTVIQALSQVGISVPMSAAAPASASASGTQQSPPQALQGFIQSLFAAIHAQGSHGGAARFHGLIQQLSASVPNGPATAAASSASLASLQQGFSNLVAAVGGSSASPATLANFLNVFANDLSARSTTGNLLATRA